VEYFNIIWHILCGAGNVYPSGAPDFTFGFHRGSFLSCHLCLLISGYSLVFWILNFDYSFCLIAWYLYFKPYYDYHKRIFFGQFYIRFLYFHIISRNHFWLSI